MPPYTIYLLNLTVDCHIGPDNIKLQIKISLDQTVEDLKEAIARESSVEAERQRLIYSGASVHDRPFLPFLTDSG